MGTIATLVSFTANTRAKAAEVNANFAEIRTKVNSFCAFVDGTATISGAWTFNTAPVFTNAQTFAAGVTVTTGGVTVTAGGLTVTAGGAAITGNSTVTGTFGATGLITGGAGATITGTVAATTFSGSGASLTNLPAAALSGTAGAINGSNITDLNGSAVASGTVAAARLPTSYTALTITTVTATTAVVPTVQGAASSPLNKLTLGDAAISLFEFGASSAVVVGNGGAAGPIPIDAMPNGMTAGGHTGYLIVQDAGQLTYIPMFQFFP